jgi:MerR family mercuric resistance operon transcriptional regulator
VAGVGRQTLRYYERLGLLASPGRSPGGHRLYPAEALTLLRVIKSAQQLGFSLREIGELLRGRRSGRSQGGLRQRVPARLAEIEAHIAELEQAAMTLRAAQEAGCDDLIQCAEVPGCPLPFPPAG